MATGASTTYDEIMSLKTAEQPNLFEEQKQLTTDSWTRLNSLEESKCSCQATIFNQISVFIKQYEIFANLCLAQGITIETIQDFKCVTEHYTIITSNPIF